MLTPARIDNYMSLIKVVIFTVALVLSILFIGRFFI